MATTYVYRAKNRMGQLIKGELLADGPTAVAAHIRNQGLFVVKIEQARSERKDLLEGIRGVALRDLVIFCRQFSTMISSGLPLITSLSVLIEQTSSPMLRKALQSVYKNIQEGSTLSSSMAQYPTVFPKIMIYLVESGELGGVLDKVMEQLAIQFEKQHRISQRVKSAMYYPAAVLSFALVLVTCILIFIMPKFVDIYAQMNAQLPLATRILIGASNILTSYGLLIFALLALGLFLISKSPRFPGYKVIMDNIILRLPVFGILYKKVAIARFSRTMGTLVRGGVPIVQALDVVKNTANIKQMVAALTEAQNSIREGFSFSAPLSQSGLFPVMVVQMVAIGEETGQLENMLHKVAEFYEDDVDDMVARLSSLLEPFLIILLGLVLGSIIISIMYPLLTMASHVNG